MILIRTATRIEELDRGDQTAGLQDHHQNRRAYVIGSDIEPETPPTETNSPTALDQSDNAMVKMSTYGRGRPLKLIRDRQSPSLQQPSPGGMNNTNPLTITAANMTDTEISRAIEDARQANDELFIRDV